MMANQNAKIRYRVSGIRFFLILDLEYISALFLFFNISFLPFNILLYLQKRLRGLIKGRKEMLYYSLCIGLEFGL